MVAVATSAFLLNIIGISVVALYKKTYLALYIYLLEPSLVYYNVFLCRVAFEGISEISAGT